MINQIKERCKELSSLHGGVLIALGLVVLFASPIAKLGLGCYCLRSMGYLEKGLNIIHDGI